MPSSRLRSAADRVSQYLYLEERSAFSQSMSSDPSGDPNDPTGNKGHLNYYYLRRLCRERGLLFDDLEFPPGNRILFGRQKALSLPITWVRPGELSSSPQFISKDPTRFDVDQGDYGDCHLLSAVSCLTLTPRFLDRVVPPVQTFGPDYCGIFRFRFWKFGEWVSVVIDDRLPTYKGRLLCMHSSDPNEFWAALLEKAYAKFYGGYHNLTKGSLCRALQDLTGGIAQCFHLAKYDPQAVFQMVNSSVPSSTLLAASIVQDQKRPSRLRNGLLTRHAYSVTGIAWVRCRFGEIPLIRLRNPSGHGEWNGAWSDRSWEWDSLPSRDKELFNVRAKSEGEFWMSFDDFMQQFTQLDLLHIGPDDWTKESSLHNKKPWRAVLAKRRWRCGYNAGGGPKHKNSCITNPQFHIHIPKNSAKKCHLVVAITQNYSPSKKHFEKHAIGFVMYEVPSGVNRLTAEYMLTQRPIDVTVYTESRETVTFFTLPAGDYIVMPCTKDPDKETVFLFRVLIDDQCKIWEINEENTMAMTVSCLKNGNINGIKDNYTALSKILQKMPSELTSKSLMKILNLGWKVLRLFPEKPNREFSRCLLMLKDPGITGRISTSDVQSLITFLQEWRRIFHRYDSGNSGKTSSYYFRDLLRDAGITVSNKVLECLVIRFIKESTLKIEDYFLSMVKLHLAYERYRVAEKIKDNKLSLEEMILMTVYS